METAALREVVRVVVVRAVRVEATVVVRVA